jgi:hypothetical protein
MLQKHRTIIDVITRNINIPSNLILSIEPTITSETFSSVTIGILDKRFSVFLTNNNSQVSVYSEKHCETLHIETNQWDSVMIGQILGEAIQKWINNNLEFDFMFWGCYGFKITSMRKVGVFIFMEVDCYDKNHVIRDSRKTIHSVHSEIGNQSVMLIDLFGDTMFFDPTHIPTMNTSNPRFNAILNEYQGLSIELAELIQYCLNQNKTRII